MFVLVIVFNTQIAMHDFNSANACAQAIEIIRNKHIANSVFCIPKGD